MLEILEHLPERNIFEPRRKKTCLWGFGKNNGADQPVHTCSLISTFVIRLLSYLNLLQAVTYFRVTENFNEIAAATTMNGAPGASHMIHALTYMYLSG